LPTKLASSSPSKECFDDAGIVDAVADYFDDRKTAEDLYGVIGSWSTCRITDIAYLFNDVYDFNEDLNGWNLSSVTTLEYTFSSFGSSAIFNGSNSDWDVSSIISFAGCFDSTLFNQNISGWDVTAGESFDYMFYFSFFNQCLEWSIDDTASTDSMFDYSNGRLGEPGAPCA